MVSPLRSAVLLGALTSAAVVGAAQHEAASPTFSARVNLVQVNVAVSGQRGSVPDLTAADFELLEDGRPQAIERVELLKLRGRRARSRTNELAPGGTIVVVDLPPGARG